MKAAGPAPVRRRERAQSRAVHLHGTDPEGEKACDALRAVEPTLLVLGTVTGAQRIPAPEVLQTVVEPALPIYCGRTLTTKVRRICSVSGTCSTLPAPRRW